MHNSHVQILFKQSEAVQTEVVRNVEYTMESLT